MCTFTPMLTIPKGTKGFIEYCNAYRVGLACVFVQHWNVIACASRILKVHNYPTHDL